MRTQPLTTNRFFLLITVSLCLLAGLSGGCNADNSSAEPNLSGSAESLEDGAAPHVSWLDAETGELIFSSRDIVVFDWDRQVFELTPERSETLRSARGQLKREYIVRDGSGEEIYRGCLMSNISSMSYDGPTICPGIIGGVKPPLYRIDGGYPRDMGRGGIRFDERLREALLKTKVLGQIP